MRRLIASTIDLGERAFARFVELEGFDRAMALAGQTFAALLPLMLVISAVSPTGGRDAADGLTQRFHLDSSAEAAVKASVEQPAQLESSLSVLSVIVLVISALSFTRALQRLYLRAWRVPKIGMPLANAWGLLWLAAFSAYFSLQPVIVALFDGTLATVVSLTFSTGLWLMTPWVLLGKRVPWRRLLPQALLTAVSLAVFGVVSVLYMPRAVGTASHQFGVIGVAFAALSWLFVAALILVVTAAVGATLVEPRRPAAQVARTR
jgi:membrane protein